LGSPGRPSGHGQASARPSRVGYGAGGQDHAGSGAAVSAHVIRADARRIPLADESIDLMVTSPPYWGLRSYRDNGGHYTGQVGSEPHPQLWLEAMWGIMAECWRVLKPEGSVWFNLGDKRTGSGGHNNAGICGGPSKLKSPGRGDSVQSVHAAGTLATRRNAPDRYEQAAFGRAKSKMLLPHRFAIGCEDGLADPEGIGWIVRQDEVIAKLNGLPESVDDRTRDSHEYFFHLTKQGDYYSAVDEIREAQTGNPPSYYGDVKAVAKERTDGISRSQTYIAQGTREYNPLGKLPGSVWSVASEPLALPEYFVETGLGGEWQEVYKGTPKRPGKSDGGLFEAVEALEPIYPGLVALWRLAEQRMLRGLLGPMTLLHVDHFASFVGGTELVRRILLGWSPHAICTVCGEGRRPVVARSPMEVRPSARRLEPQASGNASRTATGGTMTKAPEATILGYACRCCPFTD